MDGNIPQAQPQPQLEPQSQSVKNKVIIAIGVVIVAIILIVPLALVFIKGSSAPSAQSSDSRTGTDSRTGGSSSSSSVADKEKQAPVPTPYFAWDTYMDTKFSIEYPKTWMIEQTRETEGKTVVFKPPTIPVDAYLPSIMVTVRENTTRPWLTETEDYYRKSLGYQQSTIVLDGLNATKLFGTFPAAKGKMPTQSIHIFLTKDNYSYLIKYQYAGKRYNVENEKLFTSMIANFKFR